MANSSAKETTQSKESPKNVDELENELEPFNGEPDNLNRYWPPPIEETVKLTGSQTGKAVCALAFNNTGTRFAAGGNDHQVHIWDFNATDKECPIPISSTQPCGSTVIKHLEFCRDSELILVISGGCQAVVMGRDGIVKTEYQCPKGDQYISDMANTKGHVQMLNDGCWSPKEDGIFITCSNDATIRIWDLNKLSRHITVIKTRSPSNGLKATPNVCKYSRDGLSIISGCNDGSVLLWDTRRKFISPSASIKNAHLKGSEITGIDCSYGLNKICTRSDDESCKIWDNRQLRKPLSSRSGLPTLYSTTDCSFSPDDKFVVTGSLGQVHFLDCEQLESKKTVDMNETSVIRTRWHPKINHIGYTCANGSLYVTYDSRRSLEGFLTSLIASSHQKGAKRKKYQQKVVKKIITPHALPIFREETSVSTRIGPQLPAAPGTAGSLKPEGSTLTSYIARNIAKRDCP